MFLTNHVLTGMLIGLNIDEVPLVAPAALASHFALDILPHWGGEKFPFKSPIWFAFAVTDAVLAMTAVAVAIYVWPHKIWNILVGTFFAALPDLFFLPEIFFGVKFKGGFFKFHSWIQWSQTAPGIIVEAIWAAGMITLLKMMA
jgi:hypothetical protein